MTKKRKNLVCSILIVCLLVTLCPINIFGTVSAVSTGLNTKAGENGQAKAPVISLSVGNDKKTGKPKLTWNKISGTYQYKVYRSKSRNGVYVRIAVVTKGEYTDTKTKAPKSYFYKVKAVPKKGEGWQTVCSKVVARTCDLPRPVIQTDNDAATGKVLISWSKISGAKRYKVYYASSEGGTYRYLGSTAKSSFLHESARRTKHYYYKVKAVPKGDVKATSAYSKVKDRVCDLPRPTITVKLSQKGKPKISWTKLKKADRYVIYRAVKNGSYKKIKVVEDNAYVDQTAAYGRTYYYKVRAVDDKEKYATSAASKGKSVYTINLKKKLIALTFDDGPGPYTGEIVDCLRENRSHATFYVLGQRVKSYSGTLKAIHAGGNEIGNHSYSHPDLSTLSGSGISTQMKRTDRAIARLIGEKTKTMRPPYGAIDDAVKNNVGKPMILWSIDTLDWQHRDADTTVRVVLNQAEDGDIVLMHDIHEPTMRAALELIPKLKKRGFELVTVSELAKYRGNGMKNGNRYYRF